VNLESLYRRSPLWLQTLAVSGMGMRLRMLRYGGIHVRTLAELRRSQWLSSEALRELQCQRLSDTLRMAYEDVPFYRERWGDAPRLRSLDDLSALPTVSKSDLQAPREVVTARRFGGSRLQEVHTGGTTGKTLTIHCTPDVLRVNYAFFARLRDWAGIPVTGRVATFAGRVIVPPEQLEPPFWRYNLASRQLLCSSYHLSERTLPAYVKALTEFRPSLIDAYPSSIEPLARFILEHGIRTIRPRAIITSSETLAPEVRAVVSEAFEAPVFDHYGAAEMAAFVTQCEHGSYHPNPEFGIVEVLQDDRPAVPGEIGEVVATGFINPVMPLIRYRTGDLAVASDRTCACGRAFPVLDGIVGRLDDVVVTPEGRRIGRLDPIFKCVSSLREARILQDAEDHVTIEVVVPRGLPDAERRELVHQASLRLGPSMRVDVTTVDAIPRTRAGKLRMVENRVSPRRHATLS